MASDPVVCRSLITQEISLEGLFGDLGFDWLRAVRLLSNILLNANAKKWAISTASRDEVMRSDRARVAYVTSNQEQLPPDI